MITSIYYVSNSTCIFSSGNLAYWKDGRDVPDAMTSIMDYPEADGHAAFQMVLRVNFANAGKINSCLMGLSYKKP